MIIAENKYSLDRYLNSFANDIFNEIMKLYEEHKDKEKDYLSYIDEIKIIASSTIEYEKDTHDMPEQTMSVLVYLNNIQIGQYIHYSCGTGGLIGTYADMREINKIDELNIAAQRIYRYILGEIFDIETLKENLFTRLDYNTSPKYNIELISNIKSKFKNICRIPKYYYENDLYYCVISQDFVVEVI